MWLNSIDIPFNLFNRDLDAFQPGNCTTHDRFVSNDFLTSLIFFDSFVNSINKYYWSHYPLFFIDKSACTKFIDCWSCYSYLEGHLYLQVNISFNKRWSCYSYLEWLFNLYLPIFTSFGRRWSCYSYLKGHFYNYKSTFTLTDKHWSCYSYLEGHFYI